MNSQDMLLYTLFAVGMLCALWIILNIVWLGIILMYHRIADEVAFYNGKRKDE